MVEAGPDRTEEVNLEEALGWIQDAADYRQGDITSIGFTGGEPFVCWEKLRLLASTAAECGLTCSVITNGFWATSATRTKRMLQELSPAAMSLSTDEYHAKSIPIENLRRVYEECENTAIRCDLTVAYNVESPHTTHDLLDRLFEFAPRSAVRMTRVFPAGRGRDLSSFASGFAPREPASAIPCLFASVPYILPDGRVRPCVGPIVTLELDDGPMDLGSLRESRLESILDEALENPILQGLRLWGPRFLYELAKRKRPEVELPPAYFTNCPCESCTALFSDHQVSQLLNDLSRSSKLKSLVASARSQKLEKPGLEALG